MNSSFPQLKKKKEEEVGECKLHSNCLETVFTLKETAQKLKSNLHLLLIDHPGVYRSKHVFSSR